MTTTHFAALRGPTSRAIAAAVEQQRRNPHNDLRQARMRCPKCGGSINFTVLAGGASWGQCSSARCVRWNQ